MDTAGNEICIEIKDEDSPFFGEFGYAELPVELLEDVFGGPIGSNEMEISRKLFQLGFHTGIAFQLDLARAAEEEEEEEEEEEQDVAIRASVSAWVDDCGVTAPVDGITYFTTGEIYGHYADWCVVNGLLALSAARFWPALTAILPSLRLGVSLRGDGSSVHKTNVIL